MTFSLVADSHRYRLPLRLSGLSRRESRLWLEEAIAAGYACVVVRREA